MFDYPIVSLIERGKIYSAFQAFILPYKSRGV
jgi:hypothetical protein